MRGRTHARLADHQPFRAAARLAEGLGLAGGRDFDATRFGLAFPRDPARAAVTAAAASTAAPTPAAPIATALRLDFDVRDLDASGAAAFG